MKNYLVQIKDCEGVYSTFMTDNQIVGRISMNDCYDEELSVYDCSKFGEMEKLNFYGAHHNPSDPLYIKLTNSKDEVVISGYGTNH